MVLTAFHQTSRQLVASHSWSRLGHSSQRLGLDRKGLLHIPVSKASRRVSSFFLRVQLSQPYVATGHTSAFINRIFVEIGMLRLFHILCSGAAIACPLFNLEFCRTHIIFCNQGTKVWEHIHLLEYYVTIYLQTTSYIMSGCQAEITHTDTTVYILMMFSFPF